MDALNFYPPLGDHIRRHRRVNAAGQEHRRPAPHAGGKPPGSRLRRSMDIGRQVPDLHIHRILGMMHIHLQVGMGLRQAASNLLGDANGGQREGLIRALGLHLKRCCRLQVLPQIRLDCVKHPVQILLTGAAAAQRHRTEDKMTRLPCPLQVTVWRLWFHIDSRLDDIHVKFAIGLHPAAHILSELILKLLAVLSF